MSLKQASICVSLIAGSTLTFITTSSAQAFTFGNQGIKFDTDTVANFSFLDSNGRYRSAFGIVEVEDGDAGSFTSLFAEKSPGYNVPKTGDFLGTTGVTVPNGTSSFTFLADQEYSFALKTGNTLLYSTTALNTPKTLQAKFSDNNPFADSVTVVFDDRGAGPDYDFNDFRVSVKATTNAAAVPEPAALAGLGLVAASMAILRRRQNSPVS